MPRSFLVSSCIACLVPALSAQYATDFENFTASAAGTPTAGQHGFYVGPVAGSIDGAVYTYAGNTLGIPANPNGGSIFYAGRAITGGPARAQHAVSIPVGLVTVQFDVLCNYLGTATPVNNIGGVSFQPSATSIHVNMLARWPVGVTFPPTTWDADFTAGPTAAGAAVSHPDPAFHGLAVNVWHNWRITVDLRTGYYVSFQITNGVTNVTTVYTPAPGTLSLPGFPNLAVIPTDFRLFAGAADNVMAIDNMLISWAAEYTTFGAGCTGAMGVPTLAAAPGSSPTLGTTLTVNLGNLPLGLGMMITGLSNTLALGSVPLPAPLASYGFPGCDLLVDPVVTAFLIGSVPNASWNFAVPLNSAFAGLTLYNQGVSLEAGSPGAAFSNGGRLVVGH